ncbi:MAG: hypothetical protein H7Z40_22825 [Phycisphaerae bacterium]|nr:hypothetical protein [Gemmatimonadaceae bacterium]
MNTFSWYMIGLLVSASMAFAGGSARLSRQPPAEQVKPPVALDPIARLQLQLDSGNVQLAHDSALGYLPSLLKALSIPVSSQGLVFSRTSLRTDLIAPWSPRALYFNDDVYVGWVPESEFLEIASVNPTDGVAFYTLTQEKGARLVFTRETNRCLMCHQSAVTGRVPGLIMNSTVADRSGYPIATVRYGTMTDEVPVRHRFGGWYVTGSIAHSVHSGNVFSDKDFNQIDRTQNKVDLDLTTQSALTNLQAKFDTARYLSGQSDIVGLMVQVHQTAVHTLISATHDAAKRALNEQRGVNQYNRDSAQAVPLAVSNPRLRGAVERLVQSMLFINEAPWEGTMRGRSGFAKEFSALGPRDNEGRSLRDFNLKDRLFKYPLSFLIYSEGFNALPDVARQGVYLRLRSILAGEERGPEYLRVSDADRKAILEILNDTKPDFVKMAWR